MFKKIVGLGFPSKGKNKKVVDSYIADLVASWAGEFFTGYNPTYWSDKFWFEVSPNGRFAEHEQITDRETLEQVVKAVHSHGLEVFINLNAWYYTDETFPLIERMYEEFLEIGVDGIICGNIGILEYLKEKEYPGKINVSTILAVYNSEAIRFLLENYTINKIILSREVTLKEIEYLATTFPDTDFEVFGEGDFCRYNNGLCFAEHKYGAKDICTVVVNDLIVKKVYRPDFKKIVLDTDVSEEEKVAAIDDSYEDVFQYIESLFDSVLIGEITDMKAREDMKRVVRRNMKRVDLFFDAQKPVTDERNKNILTFLKALKYLCEDENIEEDIQKSLQELETSVQSGMKHLMSAIQNVWGLPKLRAQELAGFYAKWDNLNLYSYLFFSQFPNINTVKFPTRGRNYAEKIKLIEKVLQEWKVDSELLDRGMSIERAHYDLTYIFGEKLWFRDMVQKI